MGKIGLVMNYNGHWDSARFMGSSPFAVCVTTELKHDQLFEKIYQRVGVNRDRFELKLSTMANTKTGKKVLPIMYDGDVEFVLINAECTPEIFVEVVERPVASLETVHVYQTPRKASFSMDAEDTTDGGNGKEGVGMPKPDADKKTFWPCCPSCGIRYQYHRTRVNKVLRCQSCQQSFTAYDLGSQGISLGHPWNRSPNQSGVPNPSKMPSQSNDGKPSAMAQEKVDGRMKGNEGVRMHKPDVSNGKEGVRKPKPDGGKPSECGTSRNAYKKRKIKSEGESSKSYEAGNVDEDDDVDLAAQNFGLNTGHPSWIYSRQKQNVSYCEHKNKDSDFVNPPKWSKGSKPSTASEEEVKELDPELLKYPDPEFSDFDKDRVESCFAVNQLWPIYDTCDGMPRYYALIKKVFSSGFKLQITWLEPDPGENDWCDVDLPVACEVLTDFKANVGIGVAYLGKVKGFVGVFQRIAKNGVLSFNIAPGELYRFSHRIPSFRMTGKERDGVPEGSFELDPASLPHDKPSDVGDHKMENRKVESEPSGSCLRAAQVNVKSKMDTPMKNESDPNRENSERKNHKKVEAS
ncbi:hypothetical protein Ddye_028493 [Dipteronia dyeriana]|uniref:DUF3444 domain-containing protein n=1 Tax=Dipteronia dyeriana TaxID=168575 RepID=A0AAD9WSD6_9ROSI|nr:hypothetical protein Ddye_028493 [Dipteronia dyeriana]